MQAKVENDKADKYIAMLDDTICACVIATSQTYVEALKKENAFTKEAQLEAFDKTFNAVMKVLSEDASGNIGGQIDLTCNESIKQIRFT
jgi:hypothetical protein